MGAFNEAPINLEENCNAAFGGAHTTEWGMEGVLENRNIPQDVKMCYLEAQKRTKTKTR